MRRAWFAFTKLVTPRILISRRERAPLLIKLAFGVRATKSLTSRKRFFSISLALNAEIAMGTSLRLASRCWAVTTISSSAPSSACTDTRPAAPASAAMASGPLAATRRARLSLP